MYIIINVGKSRKSSFNFSFFSMLRASSADNLWYSSLMNCSRSLRVKVASPSATEWQSMGFLRSISDDCIAPKIKDFDRKDTTKA